MSAAVVRGVVRKLGPSADPLSDADLLTAFAVKKDTNAFAAIVTRHGPSVFGVCRRVLGDSHDAEDAFQAVFLVLAQKATSVRPPGSVGGWLYGVAVRTANKAKVAAARRRRREMIAAAQAVRVCESPASAEQTELCSVLDQELAQLPDALRAVIVLCDLHEKTRSEAAAELKCPEGTIAARLHRARKKLADALSRRGLAIPAAGLAAVLTPAVLPAATTQTAVSMALNSSASPAVLALAREVIRGMAVMTRSLMIGIVALVAGGLLAATSNLWSSEPDGSDAPITKTVETISEQPTDKKVDPELGYVSNIQFSPDGKQYAVVTGGNVAIHDAATKKIMWTATAEAVGFSPDGKSLLAMGEKRVSSHDKLTGKITKDFPRPKSRWGWHFVTFSPDAKRYAAHFGFNVRIYDTETGFEPIRLETQYEPGGSALVGLTGRALAFSPDNKKVFASGVLVEEGRMGAAGWDLETGARLDSYRGDFDDGPQSVAFSPDGSIFAIGYKNRIDVCNGPKDPVKQWPVVGRVTAMTFSPNGKLIAVAVRKQIHNPTDKQPNVEGYLSEIQLLDVASGKELRRFDGFEDGAGTTELPVTSIAFSPDGKMLLAGTGIMSMEQLPAGKQLMMKTGEVKSWNLTAAELMPLAGRWREVGKLEGIDDLVDSLAFSPDGKTLAVGSPGGEGMNAVRVWDTATWKTLWKGGVFPPGYTAVAFSPDGKLIAATRNKATGFYEARTGNSVLLKNMVPGGKATAFSPDGKLVAYSNGQNTGFRALDENSNVGFNANVMGFDTLIDKLPAAVAWSPDSLYLAHSLPSHPDGDWLVGIMCVALETNPRHMAGHKGMVTAVAWSRDGRFIASGGEDGKVIIWDAKTLKELRRIDLGGGSGKTTIHTLTFTPDCKTLAASVEVGEGRNPNRVVLLDSSTGERQQSDLQFFSKAPPVAVAFSPDGRMLLIGFGFRDVEYRKLPLKERQKVGEVRIFAIQSEQTKANPDREPPAPTAAAFPMWRQKAILNDLEDLVVSVAFDPKGKTFAAGAARGNVSVWNAADLKRVRLIDRDPVRGNIPKSVAYSPDGQYLAESFKGGVWVGATTTWKPVFTKRLANVEFESQILEGNQTPQAIAFGTSGEINGNKLNRLAMTDGKSVVAAMWIDGGPPSTAQLGPLAENVKTEDMPAGVAYSPDGKQLVFIPNLQLAAEDGGKEGDQRIKPTLWSAVVWGGGSGTPIKYLRHGKWKVTAVAWSPDGKLIGTGGVNGEVVLWDGKTFQEMHRMRIDGMSEINALQFTHDGKTLAIAATAEEGRSIGRVYFYDTVTTRRGGNGLSFRTPPQSLAFSPDDKTLIVGCGFRNPTERKVPTDEWKALGEVRVYTTEPEAPPLDKSPQAVSPPANPIGRQWYRKTSIQSLLSSVAYSPDGKSFAGAQMDGTVISWKSETFDKLWTSKLDGALRSTLTYQAADRQIFATTRKGIEMLDAQTGKSNGVWDKLPGAQTVAWSQVADRFAASDGRKTLVINPSTAPGSLVVIPQEIVTLDEPFLEADGYPRRKVAGVAWSPDGKRLALLRPDEKTGKSSAVIWSGRSGDAVKQLKGNTDVVSAVAWSNAIYPPVGEGGKGQIEIPELREGVIATGGWDGQVTLWDGTTLKELNRIKKGGEHGSSTIRALSFSPDGRTLAVALELDGGKGVDRTILIDTITGKEIDFLQVNSRLASVAWSPDGNTIVTACGLLPWEQRQPDQHEREHGEVVIWERKQS